MHEPRINYVWPMHKFLTGCDGIDDCPGEPTDELDCFCPNGTFTCDCFNTSIPNRERCGIRDGCIPRENVNDGVQNCIDRSDDPHLLMAYDEECGSCGNIRILRLDSFEGCTNIGLPNCDISTCVAIRSLECGDLSSNKADIVCLSHCQDSNCKTFFQCENGTLILGNQFCDSNNDCPDGSDEIISGFGFQCRYDDTRPVSCVLPQRNLFDGNSSQCHSGVDIGNFFECFDRKLFLAPNQLCDGVINCFDLSDECLCRNNLLEPVCQDRFEGNDPYQLKCNRVNDDCNDFLPIPVTEARCLSRTLLCPTKYGEVTAIKCDRIPECMNFEDECNCSTTLPEYCNSTCNYFYRLGDRYCDGIIDPAFTFLNDPNCPAGFDERSEDCTERFYCSTGNMISIPRSRINDGNQDCDDGSDETENIISSADELIQSDFIRAVVWIITFVTVFGNAYVIASTIKILKNKSLHKMLRTNHILIINLSIADFIMGIYLFIISVQSARFSGFYGSVDLEWRSSNLCTAAGGLAIISSETSCFIMSTLSTFRLINLSRPVNSLTDPTRPWLFATAFVWTFSILLAVIPLIPTLQDTFTYQLWFSAPFAQNRFLFKNETLTFLCRHAASVNNTFSFSGTSWHDILMYLNIALPEYKAKTVGFYGETSVCMPRFYVDNTDLIAGYSIFIITLNFVSFVYVCASYAFVYKITSKRPVSTRQVDIQNNKMQRRIARLLVTDFACWIPLCIIAYVKYSTNVILPRDLYAATIVFLLPINSALNPLLYSPIFEKLFNRISSRFRVIWRRTSAARLPRTALVNDDSPRNYASLSRTRVATASTTQL